MKAYLIYKREEAFKNQAFISLFQESGRECGIDFSYVSYKEYMEKELPDLAINRTRDAAVSRWYERRKIPVFHNSHITEIGNHKGKTLNFLQEHLPQEILQKKWSPITVYISKERIAQWQSSLKAGDFEDLVELEPFQREKSSFVLKSVDGHGGSEVMAFPSLAESEWKHAPRGYWENFKNKLNILSGKDCILQEMIFSDSRDVRVYILGNQVYQGILRQGQNDFRSNFSLGGWTGVYSFSAEEREYVEAFVQAFQGENLGLAGLDFMIAKDGSLIFNELEEMVGCRMLYQNTNRNIVRDYVFWLKNML